jgi:hypothetical protein
MMHNIYNPDKWVLVKVNSSEPHYRVLAAWVGGYVSGDAWRINSGVTHVDVDGDNYKIYGDSGSCYEVYKGNYGLAMITSSVLNSWNQENEGLVELIELPEDLENFGWIIEDT